MMQKMHLRNGSYKKNLLFPQFTELPTDTIRVEETKTKNRLTGQQTHFGMDVISFKQTLGFPELR